MMKMLKDRRVGTLTAGVLLIVFGMMFLLQLFVSAITLRLILSLWPVILIFLGVEILLSYFLNPEKGMRYDAGAILLMIMLSLFAMCMAGAEFAINNWPLLK
jgi:uncharacterized membrane protein HdeD (DUF308 family)